MIGRARRCDRRGRAGAPRGWSLAVVAVLGVLGACTDGTDEDAGSSGATTTAALAFSAWHAEVSTICSRAHSEVEDLEQSLPAQPSVDQMMAVIRGTRDIGERQLASITGLGAPRSRGDDAEELTTAMQQQLGLFGGILEAGESGSAQELQEALRSPEVESTQSHLDAVAGGLDLADCGTGGDGTSTTTAAG